MEVALSQPVLLPGGARDRIGAVAGRLGIVAGRAAFTSCRVLESGGNSRLSSAAWPARFAAPCAARKRGGRIAKQLMTAGQIGRSLLMARH